MPREKIVQPDQVETIVMGSGSSVASDPPLSNLLIDQEFRRAVQELGRKLGQEMMYARFEEPRIELGEEDACRLAANAVCLGDAVVLSACSPGLRRRLAARNYRVVSAPLGSFLRGGGSAFCLTLRLDRTSEPTASARSRRASSDHSPTASAV